MIDAGRYAEAEAAARGLLAREERLHGANSLEVADALDLLGNAVRLRGNAGSPEALETLERAIRIKETVRGPDDLSTARSLSSMGLLLYDRGRYAEAGEVHRRALAIRERALGPNDRLVAESLRFLSAAEHEVGRDSTALSLIERAIRIQRAVLPAGDRGLGLSLNVLASLLYYEGDLAGAAQIYEQILAIYLKDPGRNGVQIATYHNNLGGLYSELQELPLGRRHYEQALILRRRLLGPAHPLVASTLSNLAATVEELGDRRGARARYGEAIRIQEHALGGEHSDLAWMLMRLGRLEAGVGRYGRARALLERALGIQERTVGSDHPDLSWTLTGLAAVEEAEHHSAAANRAYRRALAILERAYGLNNPDRIRTLNDYAGFLAREGDSTRALDVALQSARARSEQLLLVIRGLAERQALAYLRFGTVGLDVAVRLAAQDVSGEVGVRGAWDALIHSRTLVLDEMASRQKIAAAAAADTGIAAAVRTVDAARQRYAGLLVRGAGDEDAERFRTRLDRAEEAMERAERRLAAASLGLRAEGMRARIGLDDVIAALPPNAALTAFAVSDTGRAKRYVAFIARPGAPPCVVSLERAAVIDPLIDRWAREIVAAPSEERGPAARRAEAACRTAGEALRRSIWDPIAARVGPASRVFVVPDGSLCRVNFAALPAETTGYLVESGPLLHILTSERDLVLSAPRRAEGAGLLALGGPSFDRRGGSGKAGDGALIGAASAVPSRAGSARGPLPDCPDFRTVRFEPLPGAAREVQEIARLWPDSASAVVLTGPRAGEPELTRLAPGRAVLHLATHGFFLDPTHCMVATGRRGIGGVRVKGPPSGQNAGAARAKPGGSPLRLSGLALAGANRRDEAPSGDEDGILTAEEVASLDLAGVDWAVLSACDTGVGRVESSEGVLGLRRAFRVAGAHTVIMSLWGVDDQAARRWMRALYEARFRKGLETAEAVREAGRSVLRERRAQSRSTHPFFWAGFVAAGDWE